MSKVIILSERNNSLKYDKKLLFKSRLEINSSRRKNFVPLSITSNQSNTNKKSSYIKDYQKYSQKKEKLRPYYHKKNITYINGNINIFNEIKSNSKKYMNIKNYNSTFNNFAKNLKHDLNNNITNKDNYYSNKTFLKKNLNNSVIGKPIMREKKYQNFDKNKKHKKNNDFRAKKRILSLSNSLSKSNKIKYGQINKKESINRIYNKNILTINKNNSNIHHIVYNNNTIITANYSKLPIKEFKINKKNNSKRNNKGIYSSFNSFHNKKYGYGRSEENKKDKKYNLNNGNKMKLKKFNLNNSKNKITKYNNKHINKYNNKKIIRNNFQLSCKDINKTEMNSINKDKEKHKRKKEKNININNIDIIKYNLNENDYREEKINNFNEIEEIKVNRLEDLYYLSENSKIIKIIHCDSDNDLNEEEKEEDSNILSLDDVQDIIKYYDFNEINKQDNYLFHHRDYSIFINHKKGLLINDFFNESQSSNLIKTKIKQKNTQKKKRDNKNIKIFNISSPTHIINFDNRKNKTFKK